MNIITYRLGRNPIPSDSDSSNTDSDTDSEAERIAEQYPYTGLLLLGTSNIGLDLFLSRVQSMNIFEQ